MKARDRPHSAKSRASTRRDRPTSASSPGRGFTSREMGVLKEIRRGTGQRSLSGLPDFDSRYPCMSKILDLPAGSLMGAENEGWNQYFRDFHSKQKHREGPVDEAGRGHWRPRRVSDRRRLRQRPLSPSPITSINADDSIHPRREYRKRRKYDDGDDDASTSRRERCDEIMEDDFFRRMVTRLQILWKEMKIPRRDRVYIMETYLRESFGGDKDESRRTRSGNGEGQQQRPDQQNVMRELVRQTTLLLAYRAATIKVLQFVDRRESRLSAVKQALQSFQWHRGRDTDADGLVTALIGLRDTSLDVIRAIMDWRQQLWQPRSFCWRGRNYLEKMSRDAGFLCSLVGESLLASVGLEARDMAFVLFPMAAEGDSISSCGVPQSEPGRTDVRPPPHIVRVTPKAELVAEYRSRFFCNWTTTGNGSDARSGAVGAASSGPAREAELLVVQEAALQKRVQAERIRLATQGRFVPLLRWLPATRNAQHVKRRPQYATMPSGFRRRDEQAAAACGGGVGDCVGVGAAEYSFGSHAGDNRPALSMPMPTTMLTVENRECTKHAGERGHRATEDTLGNVVDTLEGGRTRKTPAATSLEATAIMRRSTDLPAERTHRKASFHGLRGIATSDEDIMNQSRKANVSTNADHDNQNPLSSVGDVLKVNGGETGARRDGPTPEGSVQASRAASKKAEEIRDGVQQKPAKTAQGVALTRRSEGQSRREPQADVVVPTTGTDGAEPLEVLSSSHFSTESARADPMAVTLTPVGDKGIHGPEGKCQRLGETHARACEVPEGGDDTDKTSKRDQFVGSGRDNGDGEILSQGDSGHSQVARVGVNVTQSTDYAKYVEGVTDCGPSGERSMKSLLYDDDFEDEEDPDISSSLTESEPFHINRRPYVAEREKPFNVESARACAVDVGSRLGRERGDAALSIQRVWRQKKAVQRKAVLSKQQRAAQERAAVRIQNMPRCAPEWKAERFASEREGHSATKIQALARRRASKREATLRRMERNAAVRIQSFARRKLAAMEANEMRNRHDVSQKAREADEAAVNIQGMARWRGSAEREARDTRTSGEEMDSQSYCRLSNERSAATSDDDEVSNCSVKESHRASKREDVTAANDEALHGSATKIQALARQRVVAKQAKGDLKGQQERESPGVTKSEADERQIKQQEAILQNFGANSEIDHQDPKVSASSGPATASTAPRSPLIHHSSSSFSSPGYADSFASEGLGSFLDDGDLNLSSDDSGSFDSTKQAATTRLSHDQQCQRYSRDKTDGSESEQGASSPVDERNRQVKLHEVAVAVERSEELQAHEKLGIESTKMTQELPFEGDVSLIGTDYGTDAERSLRHARGLRLREGLLMTGLAGATMGNCDTSVFEGEIWGVDAIALAPVPEGQTVGAAGSDYNSDDPEFNTSSGNAVSQNNGVVVDTTTVAPPSSVDLGGGNPELIKDQAAEVVGGIVAVDADVGGETEGWEATGDGDSNCTSLSLTLDASSSD